MKNIAVFALASAALLASCTASAEQIAGGRYEIPTENLLSNTFAGQYVEFVYGDVAPNSDGEVGLVFSAREVAYAIPGFSERTPGYIGLVDASPSAVVKPIRPGSNFEEILIRNVANLNATEIIEPYGDSGFYRPHAGGIAFALSGEGREWSRKDMLPPLCRTANAQDGSTYESCHVRMERDGFELSFHLDGINVGFADEYADFVLAKLSSWKVED